MFNKNFCCLSHSIFAFPSEDSVKITNVKEEKTQIHKLTGKTTNVYIFLYFTLLLYYNLTFSFPLPKDNNKQTNKKVQQISWIIPTRNEELLLNLKSRNYSLIQKHKWVCFFCRYENWFCWLQPETSFFGAWKCDLLDNKMPYFQCRGSGSGRFRNFSLDPDPAKMK